MIRWFSDHTGKYICTTDGADRPGLIETSTPPPSPAYRWNGTGWVTDAPLTVEALAAALEKKGTLSKGEIESERGRR